MANLDRNEEVRKTPEASSADIPGYQLYQPADKTAAAQSELRKEMVAAGVFPATSEKDLPDTLARAAMSMAGKDLGFPSDGNKSSGTSVSRLLQASGLDINITPAIPDLHKQLADKGFKETKLQDGESLRAGDLVFTGMQPSGRNVGIVGTDGKIYSHHYGKGMFVGSEKWNSKFTSVMRPEDK